MSHPDGAPFDFGAVARVDDRTLPEPGMLVARDGVQLAVRQYPARSDDAVIALHGSSAEGRYFHPLATYLSGSDRAAVYVPDLRGHGLSGGRRGDVDYIGQLEDDLSDLLAAIVHERPRAKIVLLGHSSGGGLAVRFAGGRRPDQVDGYVLLSPFLGPVAPTTRPASGGWTVTDVPAIEEIARRAAAGDFRDQDRIVLRFNKPEAARTGREVLAYTFRMVITYQPRQDLAGDLDAIRRPLLVMAGSDDEAFFPDRYEPTIAPHAPGTFVVLPGANHLGLVIDPRTAERVGDWLATLPERDTATSVPS